MGVLVDVLVGRKHVERTATARARPVGPVALTLDAPCWPGGQTSVVARGRRWAGASGGARRRGRLVGVGPPVAPRGGVRACGRSLSFPFHAKASGHRRGWHSGSSGRRPTYSCATAPALHRTFPFQPELYPGTPRRQSMVAAIIRGRGAAVNDGRARWKAEGRRPRSPPSFRRAPARREPIFPPPGRGCRLGHGLSVRGDNLDHVAGDDQGVVLVEEPEAVLARRDEHEGASAGRVATRPVPDRRG